MAILSVALLPMQRPQARVWRVPYPAATDRPAVPTPTKPAATATVQGLIAVQAPLMATVQGLIAAALEALAAVSAVAGVSAEVGVSAEARVAEALADVNFPVASNHDGIVGNR